MGPVQRNEVADPADKDTEYNSVLPEQNSVNPVIGFSTIAAAVVPFRSLAQNDARVNPSLLPPMKLPQAAAVTGNVPVADVQPLETVTETLPFVFPKSKLLTPEVSVFAVWATAVPVGPLQRKEVAVPAERATE